MAEEVDCPICGESFSKRGLGSHKGSGPCLEMTDTDVGDFAILGAQDLKNPRCSLCGDEIKEGLVLAKVDWVRSEHGSKRYLKTFLCLDCVDKPGVLSSSLLMSNEG